MDYSKKILNFYGETQSGKTFLAKMLVDIFNEVGTDELIQDECKNYEDIRKGELGARIVFSEKPIISPNGDVVCFRIEKFILPYTGDINKDEVDNMNSGD